MVEGARPPDVIDVALRVAQAIESAGGSYFVGGSLASSLQGEPRTTNDIDIVLELPFGRISELVRSLGSDFEVDRDMLKDALLHGGSCNIFHLPTVMKIDLFAIGPTPYDEVEFARRRAVAVRPGGAMLVVKSPEDTVLRKLLWYRAGGGVSDRQWRDVLEVLRVSGDGLDRGYLGDWADRLGITALLTRAVSESSAPSGR
ncbi:MAG: nucleotidyl transferase AbiEii/AbiGii toxin family protein [Polyangiaceae bacterium]|nr:nucleotidyl transferase AbiEii/AbiGii toxin family protein [Polyangiaceae bacterium]